jgi:hypothetical protein
MDRQKDWLTPVLFVTIILTIRLLDYRLFDYFFFPNFFIKISSSVGWLISFSS